MQKEQQTLKEPLLEAEVMRRPEKGIESLLESVKRDCEQGNNCFNENGCDKVRHIYVPQDNPKLIEMGIHTACKANTKCTHDYCGKFKWILDRAKHYADVLGTSQESVLKDWENARSYWYMNYYQDCNQPLIKNVKVFDTIELLKESIAGKGFRCPKCNGISTDAYKCTCENCDWKSYGLFGTMGKGVDILVKSNMKTSHIFFPVAWEDVA